MTCQVRSQMESLTTMHTFLIDHRQVYVYKEKPTRYFAFKKMNNRGVDHSYSCAECHYETWNPKMNLLQFHAAMGQSQAENENQPIRWLSVRHVFTMKWMVFILKKHTLLLPCKFWIYYIYIYCIAMFDCQRYPLVILLRKDNLKFSWKNI